MVITSIMVQFPHNLLILKKKKKKDIIPSSFFLLLRKRKLNRSKDNKVTRKAESEAENLKDSESIYTSIQN